MENLFNELMLDSQYHYQFSYNSEDKKSFFSNNRIGFIGAFDENGESAYKSIEIEAPGQISQYSGSAILKKRKQLLNHQFQIPFSVSQLVREFEGIIQFLNHQSLYNWVLNVRSKSIARTILSAKNRLNQSKMTHHSVSVKMALDENSSPIEIGEGKSDGLNINRDGLQKRLKEVIQNNRNRKRIDIREKMPVILDSGDGGILFHEIVGHALEADYIDQNLSPFSLQDIGKKRIDPNISIYTKDSKDPFFKSIEVDDEGNRCNHDDLVSKGVIKRIIADKHYKIKMGLKYAGNGRTEDFTKLPLPRMYATYLKNGKYGVDEMFATIKKGIYAKEFGEGKVFFKEDSFTIIAKESYLIEDGKITAPLGAIIMQGGIREVFNSVSMIGNDFRYDKGLSYCFKNNQTVHVRVGQPSVKIDNMMVMQT